MIRTPSVNLPLAFLKPGHVQPVWSGHPWVYAQAIAHVEGGARPGDEIAVVDPRGNLLGRGFYTPSSAIPIRILVRDPQTHLDAAFFHQRIQRSLQQRHELSLPNAHTNAYRLIHAEGDDLPGLMVDVFDDICVLQLTTLGMKLREGLIVQALLDLLQPRAIVDRTPQEIAKLEGFTRTSGVIRGDESVRSLRFRERDFTYEIPLELSQKTGFYFDQRPLRARVEQLAVGRRVLDSFSFVGPFSLAAARGGAREVLAVDDNAVALEVGALIARDNKLESRIQFRKEDAHTALAQAARDGGYDLVICDPPKLAPTRSHRTAGLDAYRRLAMLGCRATRKGGLLILCSCSSAVNVDALTRALALGARDAGVRAVVLERHFQGADHPVLAAFSEGLYLKSLLVRMEEV